MSRCPWRLQIKAFFIFSFQISQNASPLIITFASIFDCRFFVIYSFISVDCAQNRKWWFETGVCISGSAYEISRTVVSIRIICWMMCSKTSDQCPQLKIEVSYLKLVRLLVNMHFMLDFILIYELIFYCCKYLFIWQVIALQLCKQLENERSFLSHFKLK